MGATNTFSKRLYRTNSHGTIRTLIVRGNTSLATTIDGAGVPGDVSFAIVPVGGLEGWEILDGRFWLRSDDPGTGVYTAELAFQQDAPIASVVLLTSISVDAAALRAVPIPSNAAAPATNMAAAAAPLPTNEGGTAPTDGLHANLIGEVGVNTRLNLRFEETTALVGTVTLDYLIHVNMRELGVDIPAA